MTTYKRIVIKLGTSTLTAGGTKLSLPHMVDLARQLSALQAEGCQVLLASSGAVAAGREALNFPELPKFIPGKQMLSAVGQPRLMGIYIQLFQMYGVIVSQVLLTRADLNHRRRYLNARNTLEALLAHNVLPIINENDTLATEEIRLGDNDSLSALLADLVEADLLVLLTDQEGLYTGDPRSDPQARLVEEVATPEIPEALWQAAGGSVSGLGTGGMVTKLHAADLARRAGTTVLIANGKTPDVILRVAHGEKLGTCFLPIVSKLESRKRYMLAGVACSNGKIVVDEGAVQALRHGSSLLPVGVSQVEGDFDRGDVVRVVDSAGKEIAMGVAGYTAKDTASISRHQSAEIESILGYTFGDEVIHRNDMLLSPGTL